MSGNNDSQLIFGVDIDGVLADLHTTFTAYCSEKLGRTLPRPLHWDMSGQWGITGDQLLELFRDFTLDRKYRELPVIEGAYDALWRLAEADVHVRIITHRLFLPGLHDIFMEDTGFWLQNNNLPCWDICVMGKGGRKFDVGADLYIDDSPHVIEALRAHHKPTLVFDQPYNQHVPGPRARSWEEVIDFFENMYSLEVPSEVHPERWDTHED